MATKSTEELEAELKAQRQWLARYGTHGARSMSVRSNIRAIRRELAERQERAASVTA